MPGHHVTDHQMRTFMNHSKYQSTEAAAAKAGFRTATGHRIQQDPRHSTQKEAVRGGGAGKVIDAMRQLLRKAK